MAMSTGFNVRKQLKMFLSGQAAQCHDSLLNSSCIQGHKHDTQHEFQRNEDECSIKSENLQVGRKGRLGQTQDFHRGDWRSFPV